MSVMTEIHDSESSVQSIRILRNGFLAGKYDGACIWYSFDGSNIGHERIVLTGSDVDPINDITKDEEYVYTASRDGSIRKYSIHEMFC